MIIDFHTHSFPDKSAEKTIKILETKGGSKAFTNGTRLGLVSSMKDAGIDCSIILPVLTKPEQFKTINEFAVKLNEKYDGSNGVKLISFGGIHPDSSDYKYELREIVNLGLKGIKLHPDYQDTRILNNHGASKVLYATDSPWGGQKESIEWFDTMKLSSETLEKILYKNALELLKI